MQRNEIHLRSVPPYFNTRGGIDIKYICAADNKVGCKALAVQWMEMVCDKSLKANVKYCGFSLNGFSIFLFHRREIMYFPSHSASTELVMLQLQFQRYSTVGTHPNHTGRLQ